MSLDWSNERYVRMYTRDTDEWLVLPWQSRAVWPLLLRKVDRSGVLPAKLGARGVAVLIGLPLEVVDPGIAGLLEDGCLVKVDGGYVIPNFIEAQEASASDAKRQRDSRERRRAAAMGHPVTQRDATSRPVTTGHDESQQVTPSLADPCRSEPNLPESLSRVPPAGARDPGIHPVAVPPPAAPLGPLVEHAVQRLDAARTEMDPTAKRIGSALTLSPVDRDQLLGRLRATDERERRETLDHCLDVLIAHAKAAADVGMLRVGMLAGDRSWERWRLGTVASVSGPRDGPRPSGGGGPRRGGGGALTGLDALAAQVAEEARR